MKLTDLIEKNQQGKTEQFLISNSIDIEYDLYSEPSTNSGVTRK